MSEARLPAAFGRYIPVARIGAGAIGTVYRAHDPLIGRDVAVKTIRMDGLDEAERTDYLARFRTEAQAGGRCAHPAIVGIFDAGETPEAPYLVMEFVDGRALSAHLTDPAARGALDVAGLMQDVLAALGYAHERGVIHRDIKPANIIITPAGRAKVADFGIARLDGGHLTQAGEMLGTPSYMAPEQVTGGAVDARTDLFSAAAVLFALLTGRAPFAGRSMTDTLVRLTDAAEADLSTLGPAQAALAPVLRQGLAKNPAQRFASAAHFTAALAAATAALPDDDATLVARGPLPAAPLAPELLEATIIRLAHHAGPMARVHVQQAARLAANEDEFFALLAQHIPNAPDAARFLREAGRPATQTRTLARTLTTGPLPPAALRGLSPAAAEAARALLAAQLGPIAKVLIAQALRDAPSLDALADRLLAAVPKPGDAAALRRQLIAALSLP